MTRPESTSWVYALPTRSIGTLLQNNPFRICVPLTWMVIFASNIAWWHAFGKWCTWSCVKYASRHSRHRKFNVICHRQQACRRHHVGLLIKLKILNLGWNMFWYLRSILCSYVIKKLWCHCWKFCSFETSGIFVSYRTKFHFRSCGCWDTIKS